MSDLLELLAQLAVTIAALSAVAGATRSPAQDTLNSSLLLRDVALVGLAVALYSFVPLLMFEAGLAIPFVLKACSAVAAVSWIVGYLLYIRRIRKQPHLFTGMFMLGLVDTLAGIGLFVSGLFMPNGVSYLSALLCWLAIASLNFISAIFSPSGDVT